MSSNHNFQGKVSDDQNLLSRPIGFHYNLHQLQDSFFFINNFQMQQLEVNYLVHITALKFLTMRNFLEVF